MAVRVRYKANDLSEGAVEVIPEANDYRILPDNSLELRYVYEDEDDKRKFHAVGTIHPDRWDAVVIEDMEETE